MSTPAPSKNQSAPEPPASSAETRQTRTREQEAQQALTTTQVSPGVATGLLLAFLVTLVSIPWVQAVKTGSLTGVAPPHALNARALRQYAEALQSHSVVAQSLLPGTQALLTERGGVGSEQAYIGRRGWLYYRPDVEYVTGPGFLEAAEQTRRRRATDAANPVQPDPLPALLALHRDLAARGIRLLVMPVPVKPMLEPEELARGATGRFLQNPSYAAFRAALRAHGIPLCDVSGDLEATKARTGQSQFLRTDTHWTPAAMEQAAQTLAEYIRAQTPLPFALPARYSRTVSAVTGTGDIAARLRLPPGQTLYPPQTVTVHPVQTSRQADDRADILLLGDSFSNVYSRPDLGWGRAAGLAEQLSFALQRPVDRIALNAGGAFAARQELADEMARGRDRLHGKRLVIYEFAMRDLSGGDWKALPLPRAVGPHPAGGMLAARAAAGGAVVRGTIAEIAPAPAPGSTPYPDGLIALRLAHARLVPDNAAVGSVLVYVWGLHGNHLTSAASLTAGQQVTLRVVPWETVEETLGGMQRRDLDDLGPREALYWSEDQPAPIGAVSVRSSAPVPVRPPAVHPAPIPPSNADIGSPETRAFLRDLSNQTARAVRQHTPVVVGRDHWLFYMPELRSQSAGQFWGPNAARASQATNPQYADPLPVILDFKRQLDRAGIRLLLVPVPAKVSIYPEQVSSSVPFGSLQRVDVFDRAFYRVLRAYGVDVLDLTPLFLAHRRDGGRLLYYTQDTHWSVSGATLAAQAIAQQIGHPAWLAGVPKRRYQSQVGTQKYTADLWKMLGDSAFPTETVTEPTIQEIGTAGFWPFRHDVPKPVEDWPDSPVVLLGDSFCMGLRAAFAQQMGFPGDMVATAGSGGEHARISLARRGDLKTGKQLVVWCFSVREFTEEFGWKKWPIVDK